MAKKKTQKISVNTMDEIMKGCQNTEVVEWNGLQVVIKKTLTLEEMLCFANSVVKSCFDQGDGSYLPEVKDFAIRSNIMERYANFALPSNLDKQYDMVIRSGAVEMIMNYINFSQFSELMKAIDAKIQNTADAHIQTFIKKLDEVTDAFSHMQGEIEKMYSGVDTEDISKLVGAISDGKATEENIVKSYLELVKKDE